MKDIEPICVAIVVTIVVGIVTLLAGALMNSESRSRWDEGEIYNNAWLIATAGFGITLTVLLYKIGAI